VRRALRSSCSKAATTSDAIAQSVLAVCRVLLGRRGYSDPLGPAAQPEESVEDYVQQLKAFHLLA